MRKSLLAKAKALPGKVLTGAIAQLKKRYRELNNRYGPGYTNAMLSAAFLTLFSPIPGSLLVSVALIVVIAEVHRAVSERGGFPKTSAKELVMSNCDVILQWREKALAENPEKTEQLLAKAYGQSA